MNKTKIFTIFTILILLMTTIFIVPTQADETVNITKSMGKYQYFMDYTNGWTTLGTPFYSTNGKVTYCLEHKEPSPYVNTEYSGSTTPFDYFTSRTLRGLQIILKNGYPNVIPDGLNADQSRYATANAIRFWLSEEGMPRQYTYTNLTNVNIDLLAHNGYVSGCRVKANTNAPGSKATLAYAIDLLKLAREQERLQYSVSFSPENSNLTKQGEYYVGQTTVILQGLTGNYELNDSVLPDGTLIDGYTGNDGDVLTISIPAYSITNDTTISLIGKATNIEAYGQAFWASPNAAVQKMVYIGVEFEPIGDGLLTLDIAGGWAKIIKKDSESGKALANAVFNLYDSSGNFIEELTTDGYGKALTSFLEAGAYYFVETQAPDKYVLNTNHHNFTISDDSTQREVINVEITNEIKKGKVRITKTDSSGTPLSGAKFDIVKVSDDFEWLDGLDEGFLIGTSEEYIETITTDSEGHALSGMLNIGKYFAREVIPPDGFLLDSTPMLFEINSNGEIVQLTMIDEINTDKGYLVLKKTDDVTGDPITGAIFSILNSSGNTIEYIITDATGTAISSPLPLGSYSVIEYYPAPGYIINDTTDEPISFVITEVGQTVTIDNLTNTKIYGEVIIHKYDEIDESPLAGAVFGIYHYDTDELITTITTDENGIASYDHLDYTIEGMFGITYGYYYLELTAPDGYYIKDIDDYGDLPFEITLKEMNGFNISEWSPVADIYCYNERENYNYTILKSDEYGIPLSGAVFELYDMSNNHFDTFTTNENGIVVISALPYGDYYLVETTAPVDYVIDSDPIYFNWKGGADNSLTVVNELAEGGKILVVKTDEEGLLLENVSFELYDSNDNLITTLSTDSRGEAVTSLLSYGEYYLIETSTLEGYEINSSPIPVTLNSSTFIQEVNVINYKEDTTQYSDLRILKRDLETLERLANATFIVMNSDRVEVGRVTTDESGYAWLYDIPFGTYYIQETEAPEGYMRSLGTYSITINSEKTFSINLTNTPIKNKIQITKVDSIDNTILLSGVEFEVSNSDGELIETITTDENGIAVTSNLRVGEYTFTEVKTIDSYVLNSTPFTIVIESDGTVADNTIVTNSPTQLDIYKVIYEDYTPLNGAGFKLKNNLGLRTYSVSKNEDGTYRFDKDGEIEEILVDENGKAVVYGIPAGSYWLEETTVPAGYYPCAPARIIIDGYANTDTPLEVYIPNSEFVNLGLNKDRWYLPIAISLVALLSFTMILLIIFRKNGDDKSDQ